MGEAQVHCLPVTYVQVQAQDYPRYCLIAALVA